jgi:hypothetical protein
MSHRIEPLIVLHPAELPVGSESSSGSTTTEAGLGKASRLLTVYSLALLLVLALAILLVLCVLEVPLAIGQLLGLVH